MISILSFFKNHFDTPKISDDTLRLFAEVHMVQLSKDTSGLYTDLLTELTAAYNDFFGAIVDEATRSAFKEGRYIAMDNAWDKFIKLVQQKEGTIRGEFRKKSDVYQEFFPYGLTEYNNTNNGNVLILMRRFVAACNNHSSALPPNFAASFAQHCNDYDTARNQQLDAISKVANLKNSASELRNVLEKQLMKNLLMIAANNVGEPQKAKRFFKESLLGNFAGKKKESHRGQLLANQLKNILSINDYAPGVSFKVKNTGSTMLQIGLCATADTAPQAPEFIELKPRTERTINLADFKNPKGAFLNIINPSTLKGRYVLVVN